VSARRKLAGCLCALLLAGAAARAGDASFSAKPTAAKAGDGVKIAFTLAVPADVEVAVLGADGKVVRHLAAGVLGAKNPPPAPLKEGLAQELAWDGKDDFGKPAAGGPFKVRVRAGFGARFGRFIGADPCNFGDTAAWPASHSMATDEDGNLYLASGRSMGNQGTMTVRVFDSEGRYLREVAPFPADLPPGAVKDFARWDEERKTFFLRNQRNLNPDFYGVYNAKGYFDAGPLRLLKASKKDGLLFTNGKKCFKLDVSGAVSGASFAAADAAADNPAPCAWSLAPDKKGFQRADGKAIRLAADLPTDWNRMAVDFARDEVYANDGGGGTWRFDGLTGAGGRLKKDGKVFPATDVAVGYDGLLYVRTRNDYSGPLERYTRDLAPAPFPATGTHVLSPYVYGRMGVAYDGRGHGVGPDGKCYVSFMFFFGAYCIGGFNGDGTPLNGKYDLGGDFPVKHEKDAANAKVADEVRKKYPAGWTAAVIGPVPQCNSGIRVDLAGNLYVGMICSEKGLAAVPPKGFEKDQAYRVSVGSVVKFGPEGGTMSGRGGRGAQFAEKMEGALRAYPGLAPYSSAAEAFGGNSCCVCRAPRFDLDRYGRVVLPNAITSSVLLYDNAGNLIAEFGKYGNFDSQYVNPNTEAGGSTGSPPEALSSSKGKAGKPTVAVPEIPLAWPTGAGFSEEHIYVNDTQHRRALRLDMAWAAEAVVPAQ